MKRDLFTILVVDDEADDRFFIIRAFRKVGVTGPIHALECGQEAIAYLQGEGKFADRKQFQYPSFIITDLKMTGGNGFSVLTHLKSHPEWAIIPTVVLSGSNDFDDIRQSYAWGASAYIVKPTNPEALCKIADLLHRFWLACEIPQVDANGKQLATHSRDKLASYKPPPAAEELRAPKTFQIQPWTNEIPLQIETVLGHLNSIEDFLQQNREKIPAFEKAIVRIAERLVASETKLAAARRHTDAPK